MVVDMFLIHNLESDVCFWSLDPASELFHDGYETLGNSPVSFLVPDDFTIHFSKYGYHFFLRLALRSACFSPAEKFAEAP